MKNKIISTGTSELTSELTSVGASIDSKTV